MKKIISVLLLGVFIAGTQTAFAVEFIGEDELYLEQPTTDDTYAGGGLVTIDSDIDGDLVVGGGSITINGNIKGDLIAAGGQITINGDVEDDARVAGGTITVNGNIGDDLITSGGQLNVSSDSLIGGSLIMGTGYANILGTINEDIKGGGGKLILGGNVYRDVEVEIQDNLTLLPNAKINGNLIYTSLREAELEIDQVAGFIEYNKSVVEEKDFAKQIESFFSRVHLFIQLFSYLALLAVALVLVIVVPASLLNAAEVAIKKPWRSLGAGFIIALCAIAGTIALSITIIGLPLAGIVLGLFLITWYLAKVYAAMFIGRLLLKPKNMTKTKLFGTVALGGFIILVVGLVPIIGWLAVFFVTMAAFGALWTYKKELYDKLGMQKI